METQIEISIDEFNKLEAGSYQLIDMRSQAELTYGEMPGAINMEGQSILQNPPEDKGKLYILCCRRGIESLEIATTLSEAGYNVRSLKGGYNRWLVEVMKSNTSDQIQQKAEQSLMREFKKSIWSRFTKAIKTYDMIQEGDKIAVCISGGKDSMLMAKLFQELVKHSDVPFEAKFLVMDPGYNKENREIIEENARRLGIPVNIFESDIFAAVYNIENSPCYLCARMRRGHLYHYAQELGCNKIALGHHYDDVIETILMSMLYGAQMQTMMPKIHSTNFEGMELIRPLYLIREDDIKSWRDANDLHFIQCACKFTEQCATCNNEETTSKRLETKKLIKELKKTNPEVESHIFKSVENVCLDQVIGYKFNGKRYSFLDHYNKTDV